MRDEEFFIDDASLSEAALAKKHALERDPSARADPMAYLPGMERIDTGVREAVLAAAEGYDAASLTAADVRRALASSVLSPEDFAALLSPAAAPFLEEMAKRARAVTARHFGNTVYVFTPLYLANYCENYCVYCGFNCYNAIRRLQLSPEEMEREMEAVAASGMEEILLLTGESREKSSVAYIGEAVRLARRFFRNVGLEVYPMNTQDYRYLRECGADSVTVFQETYDPVTYERLHLLGHKRVFPYRFEAQERALMAGMRGVGFSALLGLSDFRRDAFATGLHVWQLQRKYPHAEFSLSCPRLRPIVNNEKIAPQGVGERALCQILCAYRLFLPFAGITVSSRETKAFRDGIARIAATKVSAGVSTGIGDHAEKRAGAPSGDAQFEIADARSLAAMRRDMETEGLWPVLNDYVYV